MRIAIAPLVVLCSCGGSSAAVEHPARPQVTVPATLKASQPLHVTFPTPWAIGDRPAYARRRRPRPRPFIRVIAADNYHVLFTGPGGKRCTERLHFELGWGALRRRAATRTVRIPPLRDEYAVKPAKSWCPGRYKGHVEFRQPDRSPPLPFPPLGSFSFRVVR
jgi:hypothetical protein